MPDYFVYVLASHSRRLYIGITNDLLRRVAEHREGMDTFTSKYRITRLVYFETTSNVMSAIEREKQLKGWVRKKKIAFIETENTLWQDLAAGWFEETTCHPEKRSEPPCYPEERSELPCHPEERSDEGSTLSFPKPATKNGR